MRNLSTSIVTAFMLCLSFSAEAQIKQIATAMTSGGGNVSSRDYSGNLSIGFPCASVIGLGRDSTYLGMYVNPTLATTSLFSGVLYLNKKSTLMLTAFPNPSYGIFNVEIAGELLNPQAIIFDDRGALVSDLTFKLKKLASNRFELSATELSVGSYVLVLYDSKQSYSFKLTILK